ncbi:hypothetical protein K474DRAFT_1661205, partial [Panus rudis PR-1116 ss-1]
MHLSISPTFLVLSLTLACLVNAYPMPRTVHDVRALELPEQRVDGFHLLLTRGNDDDARDAKNARRREKYAQRKQNNPEQHAAIREALNGKRREQYEENRQINPDKHQEWLAQRRGKWANLDPDTREAMLAQRRAPKAAKHSERMATDPDYAKAIRESRKKTADKRKADPVRDARRKAQNAESDMRRRQRKLEEAAAQAAARSAAQHNSPTSAPGMAPFPASSSGTHHYAPTVAQPHAGPSGASYYGMPSTAHSYPQTPNPGMEQYYGGTMAQAQAPPMHASSSYGMQYSGGVHAQTPYIPPHTGSSSTAVVNQPFAIPQVPSRLPPQQHSQGGSSSSSSRQSGPGSTPYRVSNYSSLSGWRGN